MAAAQPSIFISYAHEDALLAQSLAAALEQQGARVWIDQGELLIGDSLIERIAEAIAEFDFVAALVSPASIQSNWCRKEIALAMSKQLRRGGRRVTVLPLRVGEVEMPPALADVKWFSLSEDDVAQCATQVVTDAARHLAKVNAEPRPTPSSSRPWADVGKEASGFQPVKIVGVDTEGVSRPLMDGSRGSALYRIPLLLDKVPHPTWSANFSAAWDSPPEWTSMHRPGIASVVGDRIVLDGTTIDELEKYHLKTLKLVVRQLNDRVQQHLEIEDKRREARQLAEAEHDLQVREAAERLRFDDD